MPAAKGAAFTLIIVAAAGPALKIIPSAITEMVLRIVIAMPGRLLLATACPGSALERNPISKHSPDCEHFL
jgi:hypothetical protein